MATLARIASICQHEGRNAFCREGAGMFRSARMARESVKPTGQFERLWSSTSAYRPGGQRFERPPQAQAVLHRLGDFANSLGLTSGDVLAVGCTFLQSVDSQ